MIPATEAEWRERQSAIQKGGPAWEQTGTVELTLPRRLSEELRFASIGLGIPLWLITSEVVERGLDVVRPMLSEAIAKKRQAAGIA